MSSVPSVADTTAGTPARYLRLIGKMLLPFGLFAIAVLGATVHPAHAQTASSKIAIELRAVSECIVLSEGIVVSESGQPDPTHPNDTALLGEP